MSHESEVINNNDHDEMQSEYDFSDGIRGKYYQDYMRSSNVIILDPDVAEIFRDSASVNDALRLLAKLMKPIAI
ncbi:MAG: hypothetical protein ACKPCM_00310 [Pseudanabaena sp.]